MSRLPSSSTFPTQEINSKFREHLSIYVPDPDYPVEASRFSPESPPTARPPPNRTLSTWTNTATMRSSNVTRKDVDPTLSTTRSKASKSRLARLFFDICAMIQGKEPDVVPIQPAQLPGWRPLNVEKRACCHDCPCRSSKSQKKRRRRKILTCILVIVLIYLLGNTVVLNVRVFRPSAGGTVTSNGTALGSSALSADAQQCISEYTLNAPSDPLGYPCSTCLSTLESVPSSAVQSNPQIGQPILNAIQFCGLRSVFDTASNDSQSALKNGNWGQDVKFCAWSGISCDGTGRVSSLYVSAMHRRQTSLLISRVDLLPFPVYLPCCLKSWVLCLACKVLLSLATLPLQVK